MPRLSITLTDEAFKIYESWKSHERSQKVSLAVVRYETMQDTDERIETIERKLKELEGKK